MKRLRPRVSGYAYIEILIAVILLSVSLAPMIEALAAGVTHESMEEDYAQAVMAAQSRMATVLSENYTTLDTEAQALGDATTESSYSDPMGVPARLQVFLARYDRDNADGDGNALTGGDAGLLWLRVRTERGDVDYQTLRALL
ncbi:MAG: type IV pilus modification PilV family protein [Pseudomonadales bacterium]